MPYAQDCRVATKHVHLRQPVGVVRVALRDHQLHSLQREVAKPRALHVDHKQVLLKGVAGADIARPLAEGVHRDHVDDGAVEPLKRLGRYRRVAVPDLDHDDRAALAILEGHRDQVLGDTPCRGHHAAAELPAPLAVPLHQGRGLLHVEVPCDEEAGQQDVVDGLAQTLLLVWQPQDLVQPVQVASHLNRLRLGAEHRVDLSDLLLEERQAVR
mmetsp:Transcript_29655/g.78537  ORF Transcript_29655/g.78537 Transcript_29655/m.78537 type:complete len:213 (-) Transcript_29655:363-1001(-)